MQAVETPAEIALSEPDRYVITQTLLSGKTLETPVYVKVPRAESDIFAAEETIPGLFFMEKKELSYNDLLIYLASALLTVFVLERFLYSREKI